MIDPDTIEKVPDLNLLFIRRTGNYATSSQSAWDAMKTFIKNEKLDQSKVRYISISHDNPQITSEEKLRFDACIYAPGTVEKGGVGRQVLKGGKYAVFVHHGPHEEMVETFDRIFLKWLPDSKDHFDETRMVFCEHFNLEYVDIDESKLVTKIYIPIS